MKILILNPILFTADNNTIPKTNSIKDTMIYNMGLGFVDLGHSVTLIAAGEYKPVHVEKYDFEILFVKSNLKKIFLPSVLPFQKNLFSYLYKNKAKFDLVISSEVFSFTSLFASLLIPSKTVIWHELTDHNNKFRKIPSKIWYYIIAPIFIRRVKTIIPRSEGAMRFIKKFLPNVANEYVDHGINIEKFTVSQTKKKQFISSSQLIPRKSVDKIIQIFSEFIKNKKYADFKLLIAGRGVLEEALKKQVHLLGLESKVLFLGFLSQAELNKYTSESYASLIHTKKDLNMVSIPESIVSGTPIVTNMNPALSGFIKSNQLGIALNDWDVLQLTELVEHSTEFKLNCLRFRDHLSNKVSAQKIINLYLAQ